MAKTYINAAKYMIKIDFKISGVVEKPDIIGAIFGQSEGLIGEDMDIKELQRGGKVGRIEISLKSALGKTKGEILVPSSTDMVETSILAAAIESVDKVGPCDAEFKITKIEDMRVEKREKVKSRARELLQKMRTEHIPETQVIAEEVEKGVRAAKLREFGPGKVPAGPDIDKEDSIIVVEGRADVINLLKNNLNNVIGMGGANISQTVVNLCKTKTVTAFVDGDRGGELNARKLQQITNVDFIAKAPDGKEVEELVRKEIMQCLKKKIPVSQQKPTARTYERKTYSSRRPYRKDSERNGTYQSRDRDSRPVRRDYSPRPAGRDYTPMPSTRDYVPRTRVLNEKLSSEEEAKFKPILDGLRGSLKAKILDDKGKELATIDVKDLVTKLPEKKTAIVVVFDGIITKRLADAADKCKLKYLIGIKKGSIEKGNVKAIAL